MSKSSEIDPHLIYWEGLNEGFGVILPGHGHPLHVVAEIGRAELDADTESLAIEEAWLSYQRRVMWCERGGDPCDMNGEWHGHWHALRPAPDAPANSNFRWTVLTKKRKP